MSLSSPILPLISSSLSLFYAVIAEPTTCILPFVQSSIPDRSIRLWWDVFFPYGATTVIALGMANLVAGVLAARAFPAGSDAQRLCYAGTAFSLGHFVFVPKIAAIVGRIRAEGTEKRGETKKELMEWFRVHVWRTALTDFPAVVCFAMAVAGKGQR